MAASPEIEMSPVLFLDGKTARELMTPNVVSIPTTWTVQEAVALLMEKRLSAVPVIDDDGEPVGVLSRTDIVAYDFKTFQHLHELPQGDDKQPLPLKVNAPCERAPGDAKEEHVLVRDIMTRVIYSVAPMTSAKTVVTAMLGLGIHRLFVADESGKVLGVISSTDILRHLHEPLTVSFEQVELLTTDRQTYLEACDLGAGC